MGWYAVGGLAALLTTFGFVPQALKMWRSRSVRDVSPLTMIQIAVGVALWLAYGIHLDDAVMIVANAVSLVILAAVLALYYRLAR